MTFDIGTTERQARAEARWVEYVSDGGAIRARFKVKPRDSAIVKALNEKYPQPERLTRAGRTIERRTEEAATAWSIGYVVGHLEGWDVTQDGVPAPIGDATVACLTDGMRSYVIEKTMADDLREFEAEGPLPG